MKSVTLIFYGRDGEAAKALATKIRAGRGVAQIRHASAFNGEREPCDKAILLACVSPVERSKIEAAYGDVVEVLSPTSAVPPPPGPPALSPGPLDALASDWQTKPTAELKAVAAAVNNGRAVDNREQAIEVIKQALASRA